MKILSVRLWSMLAVLGCLMNTFLAVSVRAEEQGNGGTEEARKVGAQLRTLRERDTPLQRSDLIAQGVTRITGVEIIQTEEGLELILETVAGSERLVPLILPEGNDLVIDILDATLAFNLRNGVTELKPAPGISKITVNKGDENSIRVRITGENQTPSAEVVPGRDDLVLSIVPEGATTTQEPDEEIEVIATGEAQEEDDYYVPEARRTIKTDTPLRDIPASVQVIPQQVIEDQGATNVREIVRNASGVNFSTASGGRGEDFIEEDKKIRGVLKPLTSGRGLINLIDEDPPDFKSLVTGVPTTVTVSRDSANRYFVSFSVEEEIQRLPKNDAQVAIDLGIKDVIVTSKGFSSGNPKYYRKYQKKLAKLQKRLAKKQKGSKNRDKARLKVAKLHAKIADCRKDFLNKLTIQLIRENQVVITESLAVKNMIKNHPPALSRTPLIKGGRGDRDVGWGELIRQLDYKASWYGRILVQVDRFFPSSKRCHACGHVLDKLSLEIREWDCVCGSHNLRDYNAALNLLAVGRTVLAYGDTTVGDTAIALSSQVSSK